jgi:transcriptional regulator with XRE-family HTH domain
MEPKDIILELRTKANLSQDELADRLFVTRQAVSRWENGETIPNTETLKLLSKLFDVSINTLLGSPHRLVCQCCGMPLEDDCISKEKDGFFNEDYCKWCYADGEYMYHNMDDLIEVCVAHMTKDGLSSGQVRSYLQDMLPKLNYWKTYQNLGGAERFDEFKKKLMEEINALQIEGMPKVESLNALVGGYINLEYRLPNGKHATFLEDGATYLGTQLECEFGGGRCFGIAANMDFILICTYEEKGENPELVLYKKR